MTYRINEIFASEQGEGHRQGLPSLFVRFAGCNLRCKMEPGKRSPGGFDCDTEFMSARTLDLDLIAELADFEWRTGDIERAMPRWIVLTGGEPMLQVDQLLCDYLHAKGWKLQIETNGSRAIPESFGIDWITVSPKVAEHAIRQKIADEVKYVRGYGQALPRSCVKATHYFISPAFNGTDVDARTLEWCEQLVKENSQWRLSVQMHKVWGVR